MATSTSTNVEAVHFSWYSCMAHLCNRYFCVPSLPHLKWFLPSMDKLMPLELRALHKRLSTLGAHMDPRPMRMQMLPHSSIVPEQFVTALGGAETERGDTYIPDVQDEVYCVCKNGTRMFNTLCGQGIVLSDPSISFFLWSFVFLK